MSISVNELSNILQKTTPMYASIILENLSSRGNQSNYLISEVIKVINTELNSSLLQIERQRTIVALQRPPQQKSVHWVRAPIVTGPEQQKMLADQFSTGAGQFSTGPEKGIPSEGKVIIMDRSTFDRWAAVNGVKF